MVCDESNKILAVGRLHQLDKQRAQIRFMAVAEAHRDCGFGKLLLTELETVARAAACLEILLHAREISLPFYQRAGYQVIEMSHVLYDEIQHFEMRKKLE